MVYSTASQSVSVLLVDDDRELVDLLAFGFGRAGMSPLVANDAATALRHIHDSNPSIIVLDVNLGAMDGFSLLQQLRRLTKAPVIMLTGRAGEDDRVRGLEMGADDYVTKPFSHRELIARVRAVLRRSVNNSELPQSLPEETMTIGNITLDPQRHEVTKDGQQIALTVTEFRLLYFLMLNSGAAVPSRAIQRHVWGTETNMSDAMRVTLYRLRKKLELDPENPTFIKTVPGVGVLLES